MTVPRYNTVVGYQANQRALDFLSAQRACPKGIYLAALPNDSSTWEGVLFARTGPYAPGVFRFRIVFPLLYPQRRPRISFLSDVFHPLITPLTTFTSSVQDIGAGIPSADDDDRLAPGCFILRHGFPAWFAGVASGTSRNADTVFEDLESSLPKSSSISINNTTRVANPTPRDNFQSPPHIAIVLYYLRAAFCVPEVLDSVVLGDSVNPSAWHAWRTFRAKLRAEPTPQRTRPIDRHLSTDTPKQHHPGGARSPADWNWDGVWEDRIRKCIQHCNSEQAIYKSASASDDLIHFLDVDEDTAREITPWATARDIKS